MPLGSFEAQANKRGERLIWLPPDVLAKLKAMRSRQELFRRDPSAGGGSRGGGECLTRILRASSKLRGGGAEQRMIRDFPGKSRKAVLRRKSTPHPGYLFKTQRTGACEPKKCGRWPKKLTIQQFGR